MAGAALVRAEASAFMAATSSLVAKRALDARAYLCVRLAALVANRLLERAPLSLLTIPE